MEAAINRYRILAIIVGVMLLMVCFVGMPIRYIGDNGTPSAIISPIHGALYILYLAFAYDLMRKMGWGLEKFLVMASAGLVPFLAFFVERRIVRAAHGVVSTRAAVQA